MLDVVNSPQAMDQIPACVADFPNIVYNMWPDVESHDAYLMEITHKAYAMQARLFEMSEDLRGVQEAADNVDRENCEFALWITSLEDAAKTDSERMFKLKKENQRLAAEVQGLAENNEYLSDGIVHANAQVVQMRSEMQEAIMEIRNHQKEFMRIVLAKEAVLRDSMVDVVGMLKEQHKAFMAHAVAQFNNVEEEMAAVGQLVCKFAVKVKDEQDAFTDEASRKIAAMERTIKDLAEHGRGKMAEHARKTRNAIARADAHEATIRTLRKDLANAEKAVEEMNAKLHSTLNRDQVTEHLLNTDYSNVISELRCAKQEVEQLRAGPDSDPVRKLQDSHRKMVTRCVDQIRQIEALKRENAGLNHILAIVRGVNQ